MCELPGQLKYTLTESPILTWEEVTWNQCLSLLLEQVKEEEKEQWAPWLDALTVTLRVAASPQHESTCHPPSSPHVTAAGGKRPGQQPPLRAHTQCQRDSTHHDLVSYL